MDKHWKTQNWMPTIDQATIENRHNPFVLLNSEEIQIYQEKLKVASQKITYLPYTPESWSGRSEILQKLGYPELAAADAWKAILLVQQVLEGKDLCSKVWFEVGMGHWYSDLEKGINWHTPASKNNLRLRFGPAMIGYLKNERRIAYVQLLSALEQLGDKQGSIEITTRALRHHPGDAHFLPMMETITELTEMMTRFIRFMPESKLSLQTDIMGSIMVRPYPWGLEMIARPQSLIDATNVTLRRRFKALRIQPSTLDLPSSDNETCYGMFAAKDIPKGEVVFGNDPVLSVKRSQMGQHVKALDSMTWTRKTELPLPSSCFNCYGNLDVSGETYGFACCAHLYFCSKECKALAQKYYHKAQCGIDISHIYSAWKGDPILPFGPEVSEMVWLRLLASCKQRGGHPLKHPLVANLGCYAVNDPDHWTFRGRVRAPLEILEKLGINIFANQSYDSWVLETLWQKIRGNIAGDMHETEVGCWIDGAFSMFNHSCGPPMIEMRSVGSGGSNFQFFATRYISKGEEIFINYAENLSKSVPERQKALGHRIFGECKCRKCSADTEIALLIEDWL